jgi:HK97 family phage major capsid protein
MATRLGPLSNYKEAQGNQISPFGKNEKEQAHNLSKYSLRNLLLNGTATRSFERDCSREIQLQTGMVTERCTVPFEIISGRGLSLANTGDSLVMSQVQTIEQALTPSCFTLAAGAQSIFGASSNITVPVINNVDAGWLGKPANWQAATDAPTDVPMTFTKLDLSPKLLAGRILMSRQLIQQSAAEPAVLKQLQTAVGYILDRAVFQGDVSSSEFAGLTAITANINAERDYSKLAPAVTLSEPITWEEVNQMPTVTAALDVAPDASSVFCVNPSMEQTLRTTPVLENAFKFLAADGKMTGRPLLVSTNVPESTIVWGRFSSYMLVVWCISLVVNPFSFASLGLNEILIHVLAAGAPIYGPAFCVAQ